MIAVHAYYVFKNCYSVLLYHLQLHRKIMSLENLEYVFALEATHIMGISKFSDVICYNGSINLFYNETPIYIQREREHSLSIKNCLVKEICINILQNTYKVKLRIINMLVQHNDYQYNESFLKAEMLGRNEVLIINCQFVSNTYFNHLFLFSSTSNASVKFVNCKFVNNGILDLV